MLYDRGLVTEEYKKKEKEYYELRAKNPNVGFGCISERICKKCDHIISDSICLCIGVFTCPNCGHENGIKLTPTPIVNVPYSFFKGIMVELDFNEDYSI